VASPTPIAPGTALRVLDAAAAARAWNWTLARQGLADSRRLASAWQVANAALGLHAARLPSPFAIVAARTGDPAVPASLFTGPVQASLLTLRCMRKTLHTLPLPLAAAAHAATLRFRDRDACRAVVNAGRTTAAIDRVVDQLGVLLQDGPLPHRTIESRLAARNTDVRTGRLAIKVAWERGTIAYINTATAWNRQARTFALTSAAYPALKLGLTRDQAVTELVTAYFDRYGPATIRDATWWSGLPATDITAALLASGRPIVALASPWSEDLCLMFADQLEESTSNEATTGVQLLAHEDTALKAYFQTRDRYLGGLPSRRAFNQIGEVLPSVIVDGMLAGTWSWNASTASVDVDLIAGKVPAPVRRQVKARAAALTETLRSGWAPRLPSRRALGGRAPLFAPSPVANSTAADTTAASLTTPARPAEYTG
jgi:Winged helix DNA-binding domain